MQPPKQSFDFVWEIMRHLAHAQFATWLCGGWAEELWGQCLPRFHQDVDLLYPAANFTCLDEWLVNTRDIEDIPAKRFSHKRAFLFRGVMVEIILLEPDEGKGYLTNFFNHRYQLIWPQDTLSFLFIRNQRVLVASEEALRLYRQKHTSITAAYRAFLLEQR